jgi:hypothetical protein
MIDAKQRYVGNAHRLSDCKLKSTVTTLHDGQWLAMDSNGEWIISTGAANVRSYITISSKWGDVGANIGRPITEGPKGRDNVTSTGMATVLIGPYRLATDQYETGTYTAGAALCVSSNGKLKPWVKPSAATDISDQEAIVGFVLKAPATAGDLLMFVHE